MTTGQKEARDRVESWLASATPGSDETSQSDEAKRSPRPVAQSTAYADGFSAQVQMEPETAPNCGQRTKALHRANEVRFARCQMKRDVYSGKLAMDDVLRQKPDLVARLPVFDLIQWLPRVKYKRAVKIAGGIITETLPLSALSDRKLEQLLERLPEVETGDSR